MCRRTCTLSPARAVKSLGQWGQRYGRSPACLLRWPSSPSRVLKHLPHWGHRKRLSLMWLALCELRPVRELYILLHWSHLYARNVCVRWWIRSWVTPGQQREIWDHYPSLLQMSYIHDSAEWELLNDWSRSEPWRLTWEGLVAEAAAVARLHPLCRVCLQVSQQQLLGAEGLVAHRAHELRLQPRRPRLLRRPNLLFTPAAGETTFAQMCLFVIGQTGKVVELFLTQVTLVDGASAMAALMRQQLWVSSESGVALEARMGFEWVGLQEVGFLLRRLFLKARFKLHWDIFGHRGCWGTQLVGAQVTNHLWMPENTEWGVCFKELLGSFCGQLVLILFLLSPTDLRTVYKTFPTPRTLVRHPLGIMGHTIQRLRQDLRTRLMWLVPCKRQRE